MVLKDVFPALLGAALLVGSVALAAGYRPDQFFGLDLSRAALSPTPLGPPTQFARRRKGNSDQTAATAQAGAALVPQPKKVALERISAPRPRNLAPVRAAAPRGPLRTKVARRRANARTALAWDPPIQTWPCNPRFGGICIWRPSSTAPRLTRS
jgi:hypothetical protein